MNAVPNDGDNNFKKNLYERNGSDTNTLAVVSNATEVPQANSSQLSTLTKTETLGTRFKEEMKALCLNLIQEREQSNPLFQSMNILLHEMVATNNRNFSILDHQQSFTSMQSKACLLGLQEIVDKMNIEIPTNESLVTHTSKMHQLPIPLLPSTAEKTSTDTITISANTLTSNTSSINKVQDESPTEEDENHLDSERKS